MQKSPVTNISIKETYSRLRSAILRHEAKETYNRGQQRPTIIGMPVPRATQQRFFDKDFFKNPIIF